MAPEQQSTLLRHLYRLVAPQGVSRLSDRELMGRFSASGDEAAFEALVKRHGPMVLRVCRRVLGSDHDAEDAFQATFLVLARKAALLRRQESVGNWLYGVAFRVALKAKAAAWRRRTQESRAHTSVTPDPLAEISVREAQGVLDDELARLPAKYRAPLVLCCLEGVARDEAARRLGCSLSTLKSRLEEARERLRRRLARRGLTVPAALLTMLFAEGAAQALVPRTLVRETVQAATAFAAGSGASALFSPAAVTLAEGALALLPASKLKLPVLLLLIAIICGTGAGFLLGRGSKSQPVDARVEPAIIPAAPEELEIAADTVRERVEKPVSPVAMPVPVKSATIATPLTGWKQHAILAGHERGVRALTFTSDGTRLVSGGDDGHVRVWDMTTRKELRDLHDVKQRSIRALALGAGNRAAVGCDDGSVAIYDLLGGTGPKLAYQRNKPSVAALTFGSDGRSLAWVRTDGAVECETRCDGLPAQPANNSQQVTCVAFSPDGRKAAWGMKDGKVKLWDVAAEKDLGQYARHVHQVWCVVFSPDRNTVASVDHFGAVSLWDAGTGREKMLLQNPCRGGHVHVLALAFSPDGRLLATGGALDHTIRLWDTRSGRQLAHLLDHKGAIFGLAFSPDGRMLASASEDSTIRLWTGTTGEGVGTRGE